MLGTSSSNSSALNTGDTLALLAEVERSLAKLRQSAGDDASRAEEAARLDRELKSLEDERARLLERQVVLESQVATARASAVSAETNLAASRASESKLGAELADSRKQAQSLAGETQKLKSDMKAQFAEFSARSAKLESSLATAQQASSKLESQLAEARKAATNLEQQLAESRTNNAKFESQLAEARKALEASRSELTASRSELTISRSETTAARSEATNARNESTRLQSELARSIEAANAARAKFQSELAEAEAFNNEFATELNSSKAAAQKLESELAAAKQASKKLESDLSTALASAKSASSRLEKELSDAKAAAATATQQFNHDLAEARTGASSSSADLAAARKAIATLEGELATARKTVTEMRAQLDAARTATESLQKSLAKAESDKRESDELARLATDECTRIEREADAARTSLKSQLETAHARALDSQAVSARAALDAERGRIAVVERERDALRTQCDAAGKRLQSLTELADKQASQMLELEQTLESTRAALTAAQSNTSTHSALEIDALADARIAELIQPKLAQLSQVASFLKTRRERLNALRLGLKRKARALRETELKLKSAAAAAGAGATAVLPASSVPSPEIEAQREELARERKEIVELREMLAHSEASVARRAAGTRFITAASLVAAMLALGSVCAWHLSGALGPKTVVATCELQATTRAVEGKSDGNAEAAPIAAWLGEAIKDPAFAGMVSSRIAERGRSHAESDAMVKDIGDRLEIHSEDSTLRLALRGEGDANTQVTLDSVASSAIATFKAMPVRRTDMLRIGIANAQQDVGRTVFSTVVPVPDPQQLTRAGALLATMVLVAGGLVAILMVMMRHAPKHADPALAAD